MYKMIEQQNVFLTVSSMSVFDMKNCAQTPITIKLKINGI